MAFVRPPALPVALSAAVLALMASTARPAPAQQTDASPPAPILAQPEGGVLRSSDGSFELIWTSREEAYSAAEARWAYEFEETFGSSEPEVFAAGRHLSASLSGREDGRYRYRVRALRPAGPTADDPSARAAGPWSEPIEVEVEHHSLTLALTILAVGAVVFLATAALVIFGHRRHRHGSPASPADAGR